MVLGMRESLPRSLPRLFLTSCKHARMRVVLPRQQTGRHNRRIKWMTKKTGKQETLSFLPLLGQSIITFSHYTTKFQDETLQNSYCRPRCCWVSSRFFSIQCFHSNSNSESKATNSKLFTHRYIEGQCPLFLFH